jgi:hypothetical protein
MLIDQEAVLRAIEHVDDTMFYAERHRRIFRAMVVITERGGVVDPLTLSEELSRRGELEASGGKDYIGFLVDAVPTAANIEYHAQIVREKAILRRLIEVSTSIVAEAFEGRSTASQLLDEAEQKIFAVSQQQTKDGFTRIKELLWPTMERIESAAKGGKSITGVASGLHGARRDDVGLSAGGSGDCGSPSVHGKDGLHAEHRAVRGHRAQRGNRVLLAGNEQGLARATHDHVRGAYRRAAIRKGHVARRRLSAPRSGGRDSQLGASVDR